MIITSKTPSIDLHGEISSMVEAILIEFIHDNYLLNNEYVIIIHGKSTNILKNRVHEVLKTLNEVADYKLDNWNIGQTIVRIKKSKS